MAKKTEQMTCLHCGNNFFAERYRVNKGLAKYCGRLCSALAREKKHGHTSHFSQSPTYVTYQSMISRCHRPNSVKYQSYGAKGISVCERWRLSFENFLCDMGERPEGTTIDRIDGSLGYGPGNCRWATIIQQQANISTNVNIEFFGKTQNISAWARELGLDASNLAWRLRNGWSIEQALTTKPNTGNRTNKNGQRIIEYCGQEKCLSEWARQYGMSISLLRLRLGKGMSIDAALNTPKGVFVTKSNQD